MVRYIRQKDYTSCGPVALINILKWMGCDVTYDSYIGMARALCKHEPGADGGTEGKGMESALKKLGIKFTKRKNPSLKQLDAHLDKGGSIVLDYCVPHTTKISPIPLDKGDYHYILCVGRTGKTYTVVNDGTKRTVGYRSRHMMQVMLEWDGDDHYALLIKPEE